MTVEMQRDNLTLCFGKAVEGLRVSQGTRIRPLMLKVCSSSGPDGLPWPEWLPQQQGVPLWAAPVQPPESGGEVIARFVDGPEEFPAVSMGDREVIFHFDPWAAAEHILGEGYVFFRRPLHTHIPGLVNWLPGWARLVGHRVATAVEGRRHQQAGPFAFPQFPADLSVEVLRLLVRRALGLKDTPPWPGGRSVVLLTHDVDTAEGQKQIPLIARQEEQQGFRSCFYIVGDRFAIDHGMLSDLRAAGHEIGLHGTHHDQRLAFLKPRQIARRLDRCRALVERHEIKGFRSPALLTSPALLAEVERRFLYDSSVPDTDIRGISAPRRGCCGIFPHWRGNLLELPLTLPLDDRLTLLGQSPAAIYTTWQQKLVLIDKIGGVGIVTTHTEPHLGGSAELREEYSRLLESITRLGMTPMLPRDVARLWRGDNLEHRKA